jgi:hypothetical protein
MGRPRLRRIQDLESDLRELNMKSWRTVEPRRKFRLS